MGRKEKKNEMIIGINRRDTFFIINFFSWPLIEISEFRRDYRLKTQLGAYDVSALFEHMLDLVERVDVEDTAGSV